MPSPPNGESLRTVIRAIAAPPGADAVPEEDALRGWSTEQWCRLLLHLPFDAQSFRSEFELPWDAVIDGLVGWRDLYSARPVDFQERFREVSGYLGLLTVTLVSLRHSYGYRHARRLPSGAVGTPAAGHDCRTLCEPLLLEPTVRAALRAVYGPDAPTPFTDPQSPDLPPATRTEWERVDFDTLRFHRHGTTSFILRGRPTEAVQGQRRPLALKCIVYPFLRVPTIVRATRDYLGRFDVAQHQVRHLVRVWASGRAWVLMDFVPGETLAEYLARHTGQGPPVPPGAPSPPPTSPYELRLDLLARLGPALLVAMAELERTGLRHCDLSPANIIVSEEDPGHPAFVLVDLGVNYLYTHALPGLEGPDATFIAPEIRAGTRDSARADVYSVGRLLTLIAGAPVTADASVPDAFYAQTPIMARFVEDLTDSEPDNRLLLFRPHHAQPLYPQLRTFFDEELAAVEAARPERTAVLGSARLATAVNLLQPLAGAPGRQWQLRRIRHTQQLYRDPHRGMHVRWLLFWSLLSATAWYVGFFIVVNWWMRDVGWNWGNHLVTTLQRGSNATDDDFPVLDALRAADYTIPDLRDNLPTRMVCLSFLLAGARYYQNIFAGLTTLITGFRQGRLSLLAVLAETHMRAFSLVPFVLVMPPTLVQPRWWPLFTATGILATFLSNMSCLLFARTALARARDQGLSTVPAGRITGLEAFANWTPTAGFYAVVTWVLGTAIYLGEVQDTYVYASAVAAINVVIFYLLKCSGKNAADVRIGLGRAVLAAERLRHLANR